MTYESNKVLSNRHWNNTLHTHTHLIHVHTQVCKTIFKYSLSIASHICLDGENFAQFILL